MTKREQITPVEAGATATTAKKAGAKAEAKAEKNFGAQPATPTAGIRAAATSAIRPAPWHFIEHRSYLQAMIDYLQASKRGFSFRQFSRKAGFASPNYLKLVAEGKKNLTQNSIAKFANAFGLNAKEHEAFELLVLLAQSKSDTERNLYLERLRRVRGQEMASATNNGNGAKHSGITKDSSDGANHNGVREMELAQFDIYSKWYVLPIREMLLLPDFKEDPAWIAKRLEPKIKVSEARQALELLEQVGLAKRDDDGKLKPADVKLSTPAQIQSLAFRNYHRAHLQIARRALDELPAEKRNITSVTATMSARKYQEICKAAEKFRLELLDLIEDDPTNEEKEEVYLIGFQIVPLSEE